jgi:hypothetical protein
MSVSSRRLTRVNFEGSVELLSRDQTKEVSTKRCCSVPSYGGGRGRLYTGQQSAKGD